MRWLLHSLHPVQAELALGPRFCPFLRFARVWSGTSKRSNDTCRLNAHIEPTMVQRKGAPEGAKLPLVRNRPASFYYHKHH